MTETEILHFEDIPSDMVVEFGNFEMSEEEIIRFAKQYDPQPFHTERHPPQGSGFHELIASGWNTAVATMRMVVDNWISKCAVLPSPGLDELRFLRPVYPGDTLRVRLSVLSARKSQTKPDRGIINFKVETLNQKGEPVLTYKSIDFLKTRQT